MEMFDKEKCSAEKRKYKFPDIWTTHCLRMPTKMSAPNINGRLTVGFVR